MKIIEVESCLNCLFFGYSGRYRGMRYYEVSACKRADDNKGRWRKIENITKIPPWCPLPDKEGGRDE